MAATAHLLDLPGASALAGQCLSVGHPPSPSAGAPGEPPGAGGGHTRPYCQARARLPLALLPELIDRVGRTLEQRVPETARWCGRVVKVADGTTQSADDTPANQQACPQPQSQRAGCGFPLMRLVGRFSLARGALLGFATGHYRQSELALAVQWWTLLAPGDGWLADRYFGCSRVLALVLGRKADAVGRWQGSRRADFRWGKRRGPLDRQVVWQRPRQVPAGMSVGPWLALPASPAVAGCGWGALPGRKKACARAG